MGLAGGKYFIKLALDIKIEFGILEILDEPNFNKFEHFQFWDQFWPNIWYKLFLTLYQRLINN